ncbi:MAG: transposase [Nitrospirae bacterium]|nr:transposase [Nitrospirota bacterium]
MIGYLKGKSALAVARQFGRKQKNFNCENFWARGCAASTVGFELEKVKEYIAHQETLEKEPDEGSF